MKAASRPQAADSERQRRLRDLPAFYALRPGEWRDYVTLLHPPYTLWHLSYVVLGAALAPTVRYERLGATLLAFFLAVGIGAHALDELADRPLKTRIPDRVLCALAILSLAGATCLGVVGVVLASTWLLVFIAFGLFIVPAYNLGWLNGSFHSDFWFALAWGSFPFLTAYWASAETFAPAAAAGAVTCFALSLAQRILSRRVRSIRRDVEALEGTVTYTDGRREAISKKLALAADESALLLLALSAVALSVSVLLLRIY
jgi:hypothetical protein